ncbi:MAG: hypothetical protein RBS38_09445 [Bacteroidales bacterium]|nr:hypothetical protein [Bacteroidales bacterium]
MNKRLMMIYGMALAVMLMCFSGPEVSGQEGQNFSGVLARKFSDYCNSFPREEMYVHTDREEYIAGEELWFTAYLFERQSSGLSDGSSLAYVELLNPENRPVAQKRILLEAGSGPGSLQLPDSLSTGIYTFRAYTGWMKNFLPGNCFMKQVYVSNALTGKKYKSGGLAKPQRTAFPGQSGGTGSDPSVLIRRDQNGNIRLIINSTASYRALTGNTLFLFVQTHGIINLNKSVSLPADSTVITIPKSILPPGINHLTLFSTAGRPVIEKLIFTPGEVMVSPEIDIASVVGTRQEIAVDIENNSPDRNFDKLSISVSAAGERTFPGMVDYMVFGSEFGQIPDELYKALSDRLPPDSVSMMMEGLKSSWIDWNTILSGKYPVTRYGRETSAHSVYGRLLNRTTQAPDPGQVLFLSVPGKKAAFRYAITDQDGYFSFQLPVDQNYRDLVIQPEDNGRNNSIRLESPFPEKYPPLAHSGNEMAGYQPAASSLKAVNYQVMKIYGSEQLSDNVDPVSFVRSDYRFYGKPDIELIMEDYIKLPVMHEVFFELMPGVFMKEKKGVYEISLFDPVDNRPFEKPPLLFVDGVVVKDPGVIAGLDPELVEKIEAVKSRYFVGEYLFLGLVNVITKAGDFSNVPLPEQAVRLAYQAFGPVKAFSAPDYTDIIKKEGRIADFRNTLYWNPSVMTGNNGNASVRFWTSDFRSAFEVTIQGVSEKGELFSFRKIIKVQ